MAPENYSEGHAVDSPSEQPSQDPWRAFSYVVTGVLIYGLIGWGLDRWWGTTYLVAVGIVGGAGLGLYLTWRAFGAPPEPSGTSEADQQDTN
ncbi:MAG: AtpZ/AtpI family protein [Nocardioides sp.]|nr:AtpZ/AtpI family protein [Nocardioides sp.]